MRVFFLSFLDFMCCYRHRRVEVVWAGVAQDDLWRRECRDSQVVSCQRDLS